jgi:cysteine-rich repeat protein
MRSAVLLALLAPACSLLFDARDLVDDDGGPVPRVGPIVHFSAQPLSIAVGDTARLSWETEGAGEVAIREEGSRLSSEVAGELLIQPDRTTSYTIEAGGETREISLFVDQDVPPEIIDFSLSPRVLTGSAIEARWVVSHGSVSLVAGDQIRADLELEGEADTDLETTTDLLLFAFAGGSNEHRERAFAFEGIGEQQPHPIGVDAVELQQTGELQMLLWNLPERSTLEPELVRDDGACLEAGLVLSRPDGSEAVRLPPCGGSATFEGAVLVTIALENPPDRAFFLPQRMAPACGNGVKEDLEECDDYDLSSGDGCSDQCAIEAGIHLLPNAGDESPQPPPQEARALELPSIVFAPFPLRFYGRTYAGVFVHPSGFLTFDLETAEAPALGHDMVTALAGASLAPYDALVWSEANLLAIDLTSDDAHVQVRFHREGSIELRFGAAGDEAGLVDSGLQERTGRLVSKSFGCAPCSLADVPVDRSVRFQ